MQHTHIKAAVQLSVQHFMCATVQYMIICFTTSGKLATMVSTKSQQFFRTYKRSVYVGWLCWLCRLLCIKKFCSSLENLPRRIEQEICGNGLDYSCKLAAAATVTYKTILQVRLQLQGASKKLATESQKTVPQSLSHKYTKCWHPIFNIFSPKDSAVNF